MFRRSLASLSAQFKPSSGLVSPRTVSIVGAPMRYGQPRGGTELGPAALREHGLVSAIKALNWDVEDLGDLKLGSPTESDPTSLAGGRNTFNVCSNNETIAAATAVPAKQGKFVLTLGGDHSIAMGSISGILAARPNLGVVWVDAHSDINDFTTSPSGNVHGMPVSFLSRRIDPATIPGAAWLAKYPSLPLNRIVYIGLRELDAGEKAVIAQHKIKAFTMHHIDRYGIGKIMEMTLDHLAKQDASLHLSWDIDAVDPSHAPSTGTPAPGGLSYREANYVAEALAASKLLGSMDLVEVNPLLAEAGVGVTTKMGIGIVESALGKSILDDEADV